METHSACPGIELLEHFVLGLTSEDEASRLEEHLAGCSSCLARLPSLGEGDFLVEALRVQKNKPKRESAPINRLRERLLGLQPSSATNVSSETNSLHHSATPSSVGAEEADRDARSLLAPPQQPDEIGRLGPYRVLRVLGTGGMGIVFESEDVQLKRRIALKALRPSLGVSSRFRQRFLREAQRMASLAHDHIVTIHHVGEDREVLFLAMPLLQGELLEDRLRREGKLPVSEVLRIGREMALGLAAAHERGVIHRDIKPANIWLEAPSGRVKILDFGLARLMEGEAALTGSCALVGTPSYMAPEQAEGEAGPSADLFSLGCVLYRMATGELAFPGKTPMMVLRAVATLNPLPARQINPETPEPLSRLIEQLLSKDRANRPASAGAVAQALEQIEQSAAAPKSTDDQRTLTERPPSMTTPSTPSGRKSAVHPRRRKRWIGVSAAALLLAGTLVVASLTLWPHRPPTTNLAPVVGKLQVLSLDVKHFADEKVRGRRPPLLGEDSFVTHCKDGVEVEARLSQRAYAFLIAFRPDGTEDLCFPEKEDEAPSQTDRPGSKNFEYVLDEGAGLHVFAVVASSQPLPSFKEWWPRKGCPWLKHEAPPGVVWRAYDDAEVDALSADPIVPRGKREVKGKAPVARLRDWLIKRPKVETAAVLGFAVLPKDKQ